ncbi:Tc toxin subunit A [Pseudomonas sp. RA_35y_Pfl2_P32]|uniref:Tc toxin subunit A n=1 Tax=Pseudomonas sp. RA_35y_Pfl2_P32 TaxID=3088705 RepID=UPI0030DC8851
MTAEHNSLMNSLIAANKSTKAGQSPFAAAMRKMAMSSVFDIVRLSRPEFIRQLAVYSDVDAGLAYDNAMGYAVLITRLYREYKTSSGKFQQLAQRSGVRALVPQGPTFPNLFKENWDEFCKVGALAAMDSPVAYLSELRRFVRQLEATSTDAQRLLLDERRPDLKDLLITHESTFTPRPMLEIVNGVLSANLQTYLSGLPADKGKSIYQVLSERRYPFVLPYNFYHQQCHLGLSGKQPVLGELNYRASEWLPLEQAATNRYGQGAQPVVQAQRLLSGLSPQQQTLLIERSPFSHVYLNRSSLSDLTHGQQGVGSGLLNPHVRTSICYLLPAEQDDEDDIGPADPLAIAPVDPVNNSTTLVPVSFRKEGGAEPITVTLALSSGSAANTGKYRLNSMHVNSTANICARIATPTALPVPEAAGYSVSFDLNMATGTTDAWVKVLRRRYTITLDEQYQLTAAEKDGVTNAYGVDITDPDVTFLADLNTFMQRTGLQAEQVERLLSRRAYAVRLSDSCPSKNLQDTSTAPFPYSNHYGACYVNGTGSDQFDSVVPPTAESILRDKLDNAMDLQQVDTGDSKTWRLTKTSLNRFDRLQRMIRLQRWTNIPFAKLDTLIVSAIRAEGEENLGLELNENTLRVLGVYRYLSQRHGIDPQEFAALMHDLTPYASGKDEVPLFDQVFNRVRLFDTPLILDQTPFDPTSATAANQKTVLQLCAGLGLKPTADSLLLIARQTSALGPLMRDLPTVSSLFRQARIAQLFGCTVAELLTLATLLGGQDYQSVLASGRLSPRKKADVPDILDVLMQLDWATQWLKDSQQSVAQLQQRLGPNIPLLIALADDGGEQPLTDDLQKRLAKLQGDVVLSTVTAAQVAALDLPAREDEASAFAVIEWYELLISHDLLDQQGLLPGLDRPLSLTDEPRTWLMAGIDELIEPLTLSAAVKQLCGQKLLELLLDAHDRQTQLLERLFQETAHLAPERCVAVMEWAHSSVYAVLHDALEETVGPALTEHFQRISRHAEIVLQLRLSNSALRLFLINPHWLGGEQYPLTNSEPSLAELYLLERFSHWLHGQSQTEDTLLSYFNLANPAPAKLKNKALRQIASDTANSALARLLEWPQTEIALLTARLESKRACTMAQVDWIRRCQASCQASGLSAKALLQATALNAASTLDEWKVVGEAVMAAHPGAHSTPTSV